ERMQTNAWVIIKKSRINVLGHGTKLLNKNWIYWFIGFCDAEGNFQTFPKKINYLTLNGQTSNYYNIGYGFHLSLSIKDHELLKKIHRNLNYLGKIYEYKDRQEIRLAITKLEDLNWLIENIFEESSLLTTHQKDRYSRLKYGVLNKFNRVETLEEYQEFINKSATVCFATAPVGPLLSLSSKLQKEENMIEHKDFNDKISKTIVLTAENESFFLDNWISGFFFFYKRNGEGSFSIHKQGHLVFYIEQAEK
uniref:LAGLIDADG endonuclease n=1 Tax=Ramaria rubella TaxID=113071 RepID=UPI00223725DA